MTSKLLAVAGGVAIMSGLAPEPAAPPHIDTNSARRTDAAYTFHCGDTRTHLTFSERVHRDEAVRLADRWRIMLTSFAVEGRRISRRDRQSIRDAFYRYSWLLRLRGRCSPGDNVVFIDVEGMPAEAWAEFVQPGDQPRPRPTSISIEVSATGSVTIR